jgi:hypothetical protein
MTFKKLLSTAALAAATIVAMPALSQTWSQVIDTDTSEDFGANGASTVIYYGLTHKFVNGHTFTTETRNDLEYRDSRKNKTKLKHVYLRFVYSMPGLYTLGEDHKFGFAFRYRAPTSNAEQLTGSLGQIVLKPSIGGKLGPVDYKFTQNLAFYLQRQRAQRNQQIGPTASAAANPLFSPYQELNFGIPLGVHNLAFNAAFLNQNVYFGKANGANGYWTGLFEQDYEIRYAIDQLDGLEVALGTLNDTYYHKTSGGTKPAAPSNDFWFNETSTYNIRLTKAF